MAKRMMKVITVDEAVKRLEEVGFHTNKARIQAGLKAGIYEFGKAIPMKEYVYEIYSTSLDKWIEERSENE